MPSAWREESELPARDPSLFWQKAYQKVPVLAAPRGEQLRLGLRQQGTPIPMAIRRGKPAFPCRSQQPGNASRRHRGAQGDGGTLNVKPPEWDAPAAAPWVTARRPRRPALYSAGYLRPPRRPAPLPLPPPPSSRRPAKLALGYVVTARLNVAEVRWQDAFVSSYVTCFLRTRRAHGRSGDGKREVRANEIVL